MLEQKIEALTAAVVALTAAIERTTSAAPADSKGKGKIVVDPKPEKTPAEKAPALSYDKDVKPQLAALIAGQGKPALMELLKGFGATNGQELKPADYPAVLKAVTAALEEAPAL